jgi:hypothetical protein
MHDSDASTSTADRLRKARGKNGGQRVIPATTNLKLRPNDFYGYMLEHKYIFAPTGEIWPAGSVDARVRPVALVNSAGQSPADRPNRHRPWPRRGRRRDLNDIRFRSPGALYRRHGRSRG